MSGSVAFPPVGFRRLVNAVTRRTGLHYYVDKADLLEEVVGARMRLHGCLTCHDYLALLADAERGDAEWRELESVITIGETFFFRYAEQFAALERTILPRLIRKAQPTRHLRIWSVGCANGAEPYSIAIVLTRLLEEAGEKLADWRIDILGTDISTRALDQAREAAFSAWSLRDIAPTQRAEWFTPVSARLWRLHEGYRRMVTFRYSNILDLLRPDGGPAGPFDLILCRNVLIYFSDALQDRVLGLFRSSLSRGGFLCLGNRESIRFAPSARDFVPLDAELRLYRNAGGTL